MVAGLTNSPPVPLYWQQSGYSLKPAPSLSTERTHDQNLDALRRHFQKTAGRYGPHVSCRYSANGLRDLIGYMQTIVNLAEQHGKEGAITNAYGDYVKELDSPDVQYAHSVLFYAVF